MILRYKTDCFTVKILEFGGQTIKFPTDKEPF
jgi:hypothetical protein